MEEAVQAGEEWKAAVLERGKQDREKMRQEEEERLRVARLQVWLFAVMVVCVSVWVRACVRIHACVQVFTCSCTTYLPPHTSAPNFPCRCSKTKRKRWSEQRSSQLYHWCLTWALRLICARPDDRMWPL